MDYKTLDLQYKFLKTIYDERNIFGIFAWGENYSRVTAVIVPTFEDVCLNEKLINSVLRYDKNTVINIYDIRYTYHATRDGIPDLAESLYSEYVIVNPRYEHMFLKLFQVNRDKILEGIKSGNPPEELKIAIMKVMRTCFNDNSSAVKFIKEVTDAEKVALRGIIQTIGDEGTFSQSKVASAVGISRLTMTNLVMKMELCGVARVENCGPHGTYIKVLDDAIFDIRR